MWNGAAAFRTLPAVCSPWRSQSVQGVFKQIRSVFLCPNPMSAPSNPAPAPGCPPVPHHPGHADRHRLCGDDPQQDAAPGGQLPADGPEGYGHLHRRLSLRAPVRRHHLHRGGRGGDVHRQRHRSHRLHHERAGHLRLHLHRRLRLQEVPHPERRRHRPGPGHRMPDCGDAAVELPDHPHLYGNGSRAGRGPHADPGVPPLQPGEGRAEHGADPADLQAGGHRPAEGPSGAGVPGPWSSPRAS